jgi:hypothetical protein
MQCAVVTCPGLPDHYLLVGCADSIYQVFTYLLGMLLRPLEMFKIFLGSVLSG